MDPAGAYRLRWKGSITGPFPWPKIGEMLRAGEISLLHNIEVDGTWLTLRACFRAAGPGRLSPAGMGDPDARGRGAGASRDGEFAPHDPVPVATTRDAAGESLERSVREGYLWCGATFLLPPFFALLVYAGHLLAPDPPTKLMLIGLLTCTTLPAVLLPVLVVRKIGATLELAGLSEIRQTQTRLAWLLGFLSLGLWMTCFWVLLPNRG